MDSLNNRKNSNQMNTSNYLNLNPSKNSTFKNKTRKITKNKIEFLDDPDRIKLN